MASRDKSKRALQGVKRDARAKTPRAGARADGKPMRRRGKPGRQPSRGPQARDKRPSAQGISGGGTRESTQGRKDHPDKAPRPALMPPTWAARAPLAMLGDALEEVYLSRHVLTQQGWRPAAERRDARQRQRQTGGEARGRPAPNPWQALAGEVMGLHEAYTEREGEFAQDRNPIHHRVGGYQFYYLPRNLMRVLYVLEALPWRAVNPEVRARDWLGAGKPVEQPFRVLDLGCGSGAFGLALLAWIAASGARARSLPPLEFVLVDQSRALLEIAQANLEEFAARALPGLRLSVERHAEGVSRYLDRAPGARFALVGAAMALNELGLVGADRRLRAPRMVARIADLAAPGGVLLVVEPGTHAGYLNTMALRESLRAGDAPWPILYPCPHSAACPMLEETPRRWCHATLGLPEPFLFDEPLRRQGRLPLHMRELNLSGLALLAPGTPDGGPFLARSGSRAVSNRLPGRGAMAHGPVVLLCMEDGCLRERPADELSILSRGDWVPAGRGSHA